MSFSKAKIKRFNDNTGCGPPVGAYNPKHPSDVKKEQGDLSSTLALTDTKSNDETIPAPAPVLFTLVDTADNTADSNRNKGFAKLCRSTTRRRIPRPTLITRSNSSILISTRPLPTQEREFTPSATSTKKIKYTHPSYQKDKDEIHTESAKDIKECEFPRNSKIRSFYFTEGRETNEIKNELPKIKMDAKLNKAESNNVLQHKPSNQNKPLDALVAKQQVNESEQKIKIVKSGQNETGSRGKCQPKEIKNEAETASTSDNFWKQQFILTKETNDELHKLLEKIRAEMNSLKIQSEVDKAQFNELQKSLEMEKKNLIQLQTKLKSTKSELDVSQASSIFFQKQLKEEKHLRHATAHELKEFKAKSLLVEANAKLIGDLENQLTEKCQLLKESELKLETAMKVINDLEIRILVKDKEIADVKESENDWKSKYESNHRSVLGLGAAEVITLGAFSFMKWKYG